MPLSPRCMALLDRYIEAATAVLRKYRVAGDSILAVRLTKLVLERHHFKVSPLSVRYQISNPYLIAKGRLPENKEEADLWVLEGAWMVITGFVPNMPEQTGGGWAGWNGHLAAVVNERMLLDITISAVANRPEKQMNLRPLLMDVEPALLRGETCGKFLTDDCAFELECYPWHVTHRLNPSWTAKAEKLVSEISRRMS